MTAPIKLHRLLLDRADRMPAHIAYVKRTEAVSYEDLAVRAARFASALQLHDIARGDRVALVLDRRSEYLVGYYGALMAGAAVVPLGTDTRPQVLQHALEHSGARAVLIDGAAMRHLAPVARELPELRLVAHVGRAVPLDTDAPVLSLAAILESGPELRDVCAGDDALASINYTSGTTGRPKGVMLSHRNIVANVRSIVQYLGLTPEDSVAMVLPYYYVYGNSVLHTHVAAGGGIVDAGPATFPHAVFDAIEEHECTGLSGVPSTFAQLLGADGADARDLRSLRYVTQAGAPMTRALTEKLMRRLPDTAIYVMYGQTEASARLSYVPPADLERKLGSAGIAIPGVTLAIVDGDDREVPRGTVGEISATGHNVMLGYLGEPEATARTLRNGRLHTGDLGWMDDEGYIHIVGRETDMIKTGGHRIGPQEVEEPIAALPGVDACAVAGLPDEMLGQAVVAFVVRTPGVDLDELAVRRACLEALPSYKVPTRVVFVDSLPRSDRGKLLRSALTARYAAA